MSPCVAFDSGCDYERWRVRYAAALIGPSTPVTDMKRRRSQHDAHACTLHDEMNIAMCPRQAKSIQRDRSAPRVDRGRLAPFFCYRQFSMEPTTSATSAHAMWHALIVAGSSLSFSGAPPWYGRTEGWLLRSRLA
jgi:hypothetical protein